MFKKILVTVDGSEVSRRGLLEAIALAANQQATLYVLNVVEGMPAAWSNYVDNQFRPRRMELLLQGLRASGQRVLDEAHADARNHGQSAETLLVDARGRSFAEWFWRKPIGLAPIWWCWERMAATGWSVSSKAVTLKACCGARTCPCSSCGSHRPPRAAAPRRTDRRRGATPTRRLRLTGPIGVSRRPVGSGPCGARVDRFEIRGNHA